MIQSDSDSQYSIDDCSGKIQLSSSSVTIARIYHQPDTKSRRNLRCVAILTDPIYYKKWEWAILQKCFKCLRCILTWHKPDFSKAANTLIPDKRLPSSHTPLAKDLWLIEGGTSDSASASESRCIVMVFSQPSKTRERVMGGTPTPKTRRNHPSQMMHPSLG
jgi:hypothetical protein